jgi:ADP-ribosylglycohydrolase
MKDLHDKKQGSFIGAAIGDAMGGPVESSHYKRILKECGPITGLVPYNEIYMLPERMVRVGGCFYPGYALHPEAGSITDDTFCRKDLLMFYLNTEPPRTPEKLASWLLKNGELDTQWPGWMVRALHWVEEGKVVASECGNTFKQGGGIGWWSSIGAIYAENPKAAAEEVRKLSAIWKAPLERDLAAAVVAGVSEGCKFSATWESMVEAMLSQCGPLAKTLLERAIRIAKQAKSTTNLAEKLYDEILMPETSQLLDVTAEDPPTAIDAPLPKRHAPVDYTDEDYTTFYWAEQIPLALAAFVYSKGTIESIPTCVNLGRDCDTTATTVGAWVGALNGLSSLPKEWVDTVCKANIREMDLMGLSEKLLTVRI